MQKYRKCRRSSDFGKILRSARKLRNIKDFAKNRDKLSLKKSICYRPCYMRLISF